ncbi:hypothetical protein T484DRAFT_1765159, partial [Baffinella frigidus]
MPGCRAMKGGRIEMDLDRVGLDEVSKAEYILRHAKRSGAKVSKAEYILRHAKRSGAKMFIETGTWYGETLARMFIETGTCYGVTLARMFIETGTWYGETLARMFIETGTWYGETLARVKSHFAKLVSIEISAQISDMARKRFAEDAHVQIVTGRSEERLPAVLAARD